MNPAIEFNLALILFAPWFAILAGLFWAYPRRPRNGARTAFDLVSLLLATAASAAGMYWGMRNADPHAGAIWKQVLATSVAYGLFLLFMAIALGVRARWLRPC